MVILLVIAMGVVALAVLLAERAPARRLPGYWHVEYEHGSEILILRADGRFEQWVRFKSGPRYSARGTWRSEGEDRQWVVMLQDAYDPLDPESCDMADPPRRGERDLHAASGWLSLRLEPCRGDEQHSFEKLSGLAASTLGYR